LKATRAHDKFSYDNNFLWNSLVQGGTEEVNHPELMRNYPMITVPSGAQWFG